MRRYNVNWFSKENITLISEWFNDIDSAKEFFYKTNIWDYFTMKTITFDSDELFKLDSLILDEINWDKDNWLKREIKTLFFKK